MNPSFLPGLAPLEMKREKVRKRVRPTSRAQYAVAREKLKGRAGEVLRWLAAYYNKMQIWPTSAELANYAEMESEWETPGGWDATLLYVRRAISDLQTRGLIETRGARPCQVARGNCCVWQVKSR